MTEEHTKQCAAQLLDTLHLMMRTIGPEIKKQNPAECSMKQFRTLISIKMMNGGSVSEVAEHLGATISSASKIVDDLVDNGLIVRETAADDRRRLVLTLTDAGEAAIDNIHLAEVSCVTDRLSSLSKGECAMVNLATELIRSAFIQKASTD